MKPSKVASELRKIAAKIQNSVRPERGVVAQELKKIIRSITASETVLNISNFNTSIIEECPVDMGTVSNYPEITIEYGLRNALSNRMVVDGEGLYEAGWGSVWVNSESPVWLVEKSPRGVKIYAGMSEQDAMGQAPVYEGPMSGATRAVAEELAAIG